MLRQRFAVILLDVNMPGLNGFETASLIRQRRKSAHTPIIFLTAFADEVRVAEGYAHGAVDYIPTPVVPEILRAKVRVLVDLYRMTHQVKRQAEERIALAEERSKRAVAEEASARHRFLAEVSHALADSLDPDTPSRPHAGAACCAAHRRFRQRHTRRDRAHREGLDLIVRRWHSHTPPG